MISKLIILRMNCKLRRHGVNESLMKCGAAVRINGRLNESRRRVANCLKALRAARQRAFRASRDTGERYADRGRDRGPYQHRFSA